MRKKIEVKEIKTEAKTFSRKDVDKAIRNAKKIKVDGQPQSDKINVKKVAKKLDNSFENLKKANEEVVKAGDQLLGDLLGVVKDFAVMELKRVKKIKGYIESDLSKTSFIQVFKRKKLNKQLTTVNEFILILEELINGNIKKHA